MENLRSGSETEPQVADTDTLAPVSQSDGIGQPETTERPDITELLRSAGLRPTRQRLSLGALLFDGIDRHVTAEVLHEQAVAQSVPVSLATVYNTLHQFTQAGLLREVAVDGAKSYFDTNTSDHHHFYVEDEQRLVDIEDGEVVVTGLPSAPEGMEVTHVDVVVRVRRMAR